MEKNATASLADGASGERVSGVACGRDEPRGAQVPAPTTAPRNQDARFERIIAASCKEFGVTRAQIMGKERHRHLSQARQVVAYLARQILGWSFPWLGKQLGHADHTSAMHSVNKIGALVKADRQWATIVERIRNRAEGPASGDVVDVPGLFAAGRE